MKRSGQNDVSPWQSPWPLADKVALVVGGSRGIGLALARRLDQQGCQVVIAGRSSARVAAAQKEMPRAMGCADCDVRQSASVDKLFADILQRFGRVDVAVNSAGIGRGSSARLVPDTTANLDEAQWSEVIDTNLRGGFLVARAAARAMIARREGQIVNISSARGARRGQPFAAAYCAAKMGCLAMFQSLAEELRPLGIRVWSLLPDAVDTELIAGTNLAQRGSLPAAGLADAIVDLLSLPADAQWSDPLIAPFGGPVDSLAEARV